MAAASTIIGIIGVVIAAAGAATSAVRANQQADAQQKAFEYNAAVERNNAILAKRESGFQADRIRKRNRILLSRQKATYAKGGVALDGTPEDVIFDSAIEGELDALAALYTGDVRSLSAKQEAERQTARASAVENARAMTMSSGILSGAASTASAASNVAYRIEYRGNPDI